FWHKVLYDLGHVSTPEPFMKLVHQGMILGEDNQKMSKSRGNVVNPDEIIERYGADAMRLYEMFMGPLEATKPWQTTGVDGVRRFLDRAWRLFVSDEDESDALIVDDSALTTDDQKVLHRTIKKVTEDLDGMRFNTAISAMMEFVNHFTKCGRSPRAALTPFAQLLAPFAPHMGEELWARLGHSGTLAYVPWPTWDEAFCVDDTVLYPVQVNGKMRGQIDLPKDVDQATALAAAKAVENVARHLEGKQLVREIFVAGRMINLVVK
ncbi:MAG: class I tRNA ligase family protein, partial [Myxococcales bacterium]|nr:class I tRNA ligase family protein [Myxococcales bacterium]